MGYASRLIVGGLLGIASGAAKGFVDSALEEQKAKIQAQRDEQLSRLRMQEHGANTTADIVAKKASEEADATQRADFYKRTTMAPITTTVDGQDAAESGGTLTEGATSTTPRTRREQADSRLEEAKKTGRADLINQTYTEMKDVRADDAEERKQKGEERRSEIQSRLAAVREEQARISELNAEDRARRTDAMIAKAMGTTADKEPAKIREVKALAEIAFGGDIEKAVAFAYGAQDKSRTAAVMSTAQMLQRGGEGDNVQDTIAKAEQIVDTLRSKEGASRGGVSTKPATASATSAPTFTTAEDVRAAYQSGKLTRDQAKAELRRFGYQ